MCASTLYDSAFAFLVKNRSTSVSYHSSTENDFSKAMLAVASKS